MNDLDRAAEILRACERTVLLTGAGVSAESGVPTFRDALDGLWAKYDPMQLATPQAFEADPALVTRWYDERRRRVASCEPNAAHRAISRWGAALGPDRFTLLTQNVDRLHQRAGSENAVELHGTLLVWRCTLTGETAADLPVPLPHCPMPSPAGGLYRPDVVWFGESLPPEAMRTAARAIEDCDVIVSIGTSAVVEPAASFVAWARNHGAAAIEINRDATPISDAVDVSIRGLAAEIVPALVERLLRVD